MTTSTQKVSIIVPVYNKERFLRDCVDSLLRQTHTNIEVMLIDDGSPDQCGNICDQYASADSRVRVIHQANSGVSAARYNGVAAATGDWACFVDADDNLPDHGIEALLKHSDGYDLVSGRFTTRDLEQGKELPIPSNIQEIGDKDGHQFVDSLIRNSRFQSLCRQLFKMDILKKNIIAIPPQVKVAEDLLLNIQLGLHIQKVRGIDDIVYYYNIYPDNTINTHPMTYEERVYVDAFIEQLIGQDPTYEEALYRRRLNFLDLGFIARKGILQTPIGVFVKEKSKIYPNLRPRDKVLSFLCRISNDPLRSLLWSTYKQLQKRFGKLFRKP